MMRPLLMAVLAAGTLTVLSAVPAAAAVSTVRAVPIQVDGTLLAANGYLDSGVTYAPLRALLDAFGGWDLRWDSASGTAVATGPDSSMTADPGGSAVTVDGHTYPGTVFVLEGRTYVPLRTTASACGGEVRWDGQLGGAVVVTGGADYDQEDLYWLSRIISAESQGEPFQGQLAVGNVVLNRVADPEFPNSIKEVIFDTAGGFQFEPVENGTVYLEPTAQSVEAARQVLNGAKAVDDCLFFYAPALSQGLWINQTRTYSTTIGCHRFYL